MPDVVILPVIKCYGAQVAGLLAVTLGGAEAGRFLFVSLICLFYLQCKNFLMPGKGVYEDLRRRLPLYPSDFTDGTRI